MKLSDILEALGACAVVAGLSMVAVWAGVVAAGVLLIAAGIAAGR